MYYPKRNSISFGARILPLISELPSSKFKRTEERRATGAKNKKHVNMQREYNMGISPNDFFPSADNCLLSLFRKIRTKTVRQNLDDPRFVRFKSKFKREQYTSTKSSNNNNEVRVNTYMITHESAHSNDIQSDIKDDGIMEDLNCSNLDTTKRFIQRSLPMITGNFLINLEEPRGSMGRFEYDFVNKIIHDETRIPDQIIAEGIYINFKFLEFVTAFFTTISKIYLIG
jgi:hypothetical protein